MFVLKHMRDISNGRARSLLGAHASKRTNTVCLSDVSTWYT